MEQKEEIINLWKANGFVGADKLYKILKSKDIKIKHNELNQLIKDQKTSQIHRKFKKNKKVLAHIVSYGENNNWQMDLSDMTEYSTKNNGYKYILLAVDVFTRKAFAQPLKNKLEKTVTEAFNKMVESEKPQTITSDNGSEFINKEFQANASEKNIELVNVQVGDHHALGIIDRLTRTLKEMTHKYFTENDSVRWIDHLPDLIKTYNNLPHMGINNHSPNESKKFFPELLKLNLQKAEQTNELKPDIGVGDVVRVKLPKTPFTKGYVPQFSNETYKIIRVMKVSVILDNGKRYKISDVLKVSDETRDVLPFANPKPKPKPKPLAIDMNKSEVQKEKAFKKSGLEKSSIVEGKRIRKVKKFGGRFSDEDD